MKKTLLILASSLSLFIAGCSKPSSGDNKIQIALSGSGAPSATLGNDMDLYVDSNNMNVYCKEDEKWIPTETITSEIMTAQYKKDVIAAKINALANSFYSSNIVVDFEMKSEDVFTHEIAHFNCGVLFNEVYTSEEAYTSRDKTSAYYQYQTFYYENGLHYAEIQGGEKHLIDESDFFYGMAANTFDKAFSSQLTCDSLAKELFEIIKENKSELSFETMGVSFTLSNFAFNFDFDKEVLTSMTFKNTQYGINYSCQFSNYGQVE